MRFSLRERKCAEKLLERALFEDKADKDLTSILSCSDREARFSLRTRQDIAVSGLEIVELGFPKAKIAFECEDGDKLKAGETLATVEGPLRPILTAERSVLNLLQRMCGVATLTAKYVSAAQGLVKIVDTRTKPGGFEGNGEKALPWMKQVKDETHMLVATEVATPEHVELALKYDMDILWIGARTTANPFAMQALADAMKGVDVPVFVKNPVNPDLELWIGALQRLNQAGVKRLGAIHRGFSSYEQKIYRNAPMWQIPIELHRRIPELPIISDPSHIGGRRELIAPLCQQAMDLGFDGLIVESHCDPDKAWSDAKQQVTPDVLDYILSLLIIRDEHVTTEGIQQLRKQIDELDNQLMDLLAKRMQVCRQIGEYKKEHNMTVLQASRYNEILEKRGVQGTLTGMAAEFVAKVFESIHEESVRQQIEIVNK